MYLIFNGVTMIEVAQHGFVIIRWPVRNRQSAPEYSRKIKGLHASACNPFFAHWIWDRPM